MRRAPDGPAVERGEIPADESPEQSGVEAAVAHESGVEAAVAHESVNRLVDEGSAYLRSAAHQPVDWHPWGPEAFGRARETDRPILLDVGAVWCHWCHVMDRESYEDPELARIINESFVAIKVDRDERPDVDRRYQRAVGVIAGQGGWPLTGFLTPEGKVFYGGTYFPPRPAHGRPSFRDVLERVAAAYRAQTAQVREQAEQLFEAVSRRLPARAEAAAEAVPAPGEPLLVAAERAMERAYDPSYGGFGGAPKFPNPGALALLYARHFRTGRRHLAEIARHTLTAMAYGGIRDHVGGGFHRYSVDARWIVPHFEKMSYDNAELLAAYAVGYAAEGEPLFLETVRETIRFFREVLEEEGGGFRGSQDADVDLSDDGDYFTWTPDEVDAALPPEQAEVVKLRFHVHEEGEMHHDPRRNVLFANVDAEAVARRLGREVEAVEDLLRLGLEGLRQARAERRAPFVDSTLYVNWNGLCVSAYCRAFRALSGRGAEAERLREFASRTFERLWSEAHDAERGFAHTLREGRAEVWGLLDDQVKMGLAAADLFEVTGNPTYLGRARAIARVVRERFEDRELGGFYDLEQGIGSGEPVAAPLSERQKPVEDDPVPSANGTAAQLFLRLATLTGDEEFRTVALRTLAALAREAEQLAHHTAAYLLALDASLAPETRVVVVGDPVEEVTRALLGAAWGMYRPYAVVVPLAAAAERDASDGEPTHRAATDREATDGEATARAATDRAAPDSAVKLPPEMEAMLRTAPLGKALAYLCAGTACAAPTDDPAEVVRLLREFGREPAS